MASIAAFVYFWSAAYEVSGGCTTDTLYPSFLRMLATAFQPEPSAKAPCTRTTFLIFCFTIILLCCKDPFGPIEFLMSNVCVAKRLLSCPRDVPLTFSVKIYALLIGVCGGGSLFDELGCFLRVRHVGHMAGIDFDRLGIGALGHHALLYRIDRPIRAGHHVPRRLVPPRWIRDLVGERVGGDRHLRYRHEMSLSCGNI